MATCTSSPCLLKLRAISHGCVVPRTWRHRVKRAAACFPLPNVHKHRAFVGECNCGKHGCCVEMLTWWPRRACRGRTKTVSCSCFFSPLLQHVGASSLEVLKAMLDGAMGSLIWCLTWWLATLPMAGGWKQMFFEVPSNPSHSMVL